MGYYGVGQATMACGAITPVPDIAFSMGTDTGSVNAFHFDVVAQGTSTRNAVSFNNQSFWVAGPGGSDSC